MFKKIISIIFFLTFFVSTNIFSEEKLAFIDINYIYSNSEAGKKINNEIQSKNKKINSELSNFQKKIYSKKKNSFNSKKCYI